MSQRPATYDACDGRCVGCGKRLQCSGSSWDWQAHHVVKAQTLRRRGVRPARIRDATYTILLCRRCHERHESRNAPVPLEALPRSVVEACDALGPWAEDLLRIYHPPAAERTSAP